MLGGEITGVTPETVVGETARIKYEGYRLVTLSCVEIDGETVEVLYHFDRGLALTHFRLRLPKNATLSSISTVYPAAFLVENEIQDLFGVRFSGLAIDFNRTLYLEGASPKAPFCRYATVETAAAAGSEAAPPVADA